MIYYIKKGLKILSNEGIKVFSQKLWNKTNSILTRRTAYKKWIKTYEKDIFYTEVLDYNPKISIIVPVYNVDKKLLLQCINSVLNQTYKNWELCMVDDASTTGFVKRILRKYEDIPKVKVHYRTENGHISKATNDGIRLATGEFIALLDCDDILAPNALFEMVKKLNEGCSYDFIYSDEDKITKNGKKRHAPFFKPDWSPDTLMSLMYTCHLSMFRKSIIDELGGMRVGFEGAQDYDLTLRFTEKTNRIGHVPKVLYHWRESKKSTSLNIEAKPYIFEATKKAKEEALERRGLVGNLEYIPDIYQFRIKYYNYENPKVSIVIPSKDNFAMLKQCVESIILSTTYKNYEIIIIDNGSNNTNRQLYKDYCNNRKILYYYEEMEFNFSKMCNKGSVLAVGSFLLFLNDDIELICKDWIELLVGHGSLPYVGAVGAKLYYPNTNIIQHTGVINLEVGPSHAFVGFNDRMPYYFNRNYIEYNYSAVTGACLLIEKCKFDEVNGFDESYPVAYNDVDLCFKLLEKGYYNVVRTDVTLYHHESASRGYDLEDKMKTERLRKELCKLYQKHKNIEKKDPFYNVNLTANNIDFNYKS